MPPAAIYFGAINMICQKLTSHSIAPIAASLCTETRSIPQHWMRVSWRSTRQPAARYGTAPFRIIISATTSPWHHWPLTVRSWSALLEGNWAFGGSSWHWTQKPEKKSGGPIQFQLLANREIKPGRASLGGPVVQQYGFRATMTRSSASPTSAPAIRDRGSEIRDQETISTPTQCWLLISKQEKFRHIISITGTAHGIGTRFLRRS